MIATTAIDESCHSSSAEEVKSLDKSFEDITVNSWRKTCYGLGSLSRKAMEAVTGFYLTIYLLEVVRLQPGYLSINEFAVCFLDLLSKPVVGLVINRFQSRFGRYRPWLLISAPFTCTFFVLLWYVPANPSKPVRLVYVIFLYWLFHLSLSFFTVAYASLAMSMSNSPRVFESLTAYRHGFATVGAVVGMLVHATLFSLQPPSATAEVHTIEQWKVFAEGQRSMHLLTAGVLVLVHMACAAMVFFSTEEKLLVVQQQRLSLTESLQKLRSVLSFSPFQFLIAIYFLLTCGSALVNTNYALYFKYVLHASGLFPYVLLLMNTVGAISVPFCKTVLLTRIGHQWTLTVVALPLMAVFGLHLYLTPNNLPAIVLVPVAVGILGNWATLVQLSMLPDVIGAYGVQHGYGSESLFIMTVEFFDRIGSALCNAVSALLLQAFGYVQSSAVQLQSVQTLLRILEGCLPVLMFLCVLILVWEHPINNHTRRRLHENIKRSISVHCNNYIEGRNQKKNSNTLLGSQQHKTNGYGTLEPKSNSTHEMGIPSC